ncbi:hypothetical protein [Prochlorococcus marinus]|uniref:Uncharacterized protein n=1 Tax=Prochlorococcus marinus XMU1408 TaxID=2213228 RepID=A0A318R8B4_PROMR|nr:hypothetical protein [Prochlorococcus marinus]MBW3042273.1 hypothetical protein [Prochlorococcus marinus str. XMU1408]PYE01661.1 hypothetical protein DNJ73_06150 [Prochlorococcus marinus XMU1408]
MFINNILDLLTFITINIENADISNIDEFISDYQQIKPIEDPVFWISCGAFICLMSGLIFADIMKSKLRNWSAEKISPLPLENPRTMSSWFSFFTGLTIIFVSALSIINFSIIKSLIFSSIISILFGLSMWKAIKDLLVQVENGTIKEIDDFF